MKTVIYIGLFSALVSLVGTLLGAALGVFIKNPSAKLMGTILGVATGIMVSIVFLELIPEALNYNGFIDTLLFVSFGIIIILLTDMLSKETSLHKDAHMKVAFLMALGIMLHNFPEGLIMGFGFLKEADLGIKMSILISIHDMPEGLAMATPLIISGVKPSKILFYAFLVALPTTIGAWLGIILGTISQAILGKCLAFASGVMLYVIFGQMLPESNELTDNFTTTLSILGGIVLGFIMLNVI